jgi:CRISPR-associated protein Cas2
MFVLIAYDVTANRTRRFHKMLSRYLMHEQNSLFAGDLSDGTLKRLHHDLARIARTEDRIFQVIAENRHNVSVALICKSGGNNVLEKVGHNHHALDAVIV